MTSGQRALTATVTTVLVVVAAAVASVPGAAAAPRVLRTGPWIGEYRVIVDHADQNGSGKFHEDSSGACSFSADGSGHEAVGLLGGSAPMTVTGAGPPGELHAPAPSFAVELGGIAELRAWGSITRQGKTTSTPDPRPCAGGGGGGRVASGPPPDCGTKPAAKAFSLTPATAHQMRFDAPSFGPPAKDPFANCASFVEHPYPSTLPVDLGYSPGEFGPGMGPATLRGHATHPFSGAYLSGLERADVELRVVPVAIAPALVLASRATDERIDGRGYMTARVACPAGRSACSGTLSVAAGSGAQPAKPVAVAAAAATKGARYPAPLNTGGFVYTWTAGSVRFSLRPRQHKRLRLRLAAHGHEDLAQLRGMALWLDVSHKQGRHRLAYAIGSAHTG